MLENRVIGMLLVAMSCIADNRLRLAGCGNTCELPQPRAIRVATLIQTKEEVYPYMTIIHRCDEGSGCCREIGKTCQMYSSEELHVEVLFTTRREYVPTTVLNHTRCSCQLESNVIK